MPAKRSRLGRGDKIVVTSPYGSRLGTYDLTTGEVSDVAPAFRDTFTAELDEWLARHGASPFPGFGPAGAPVEPPSRRTRMTSRLSDTLGFPRLSDAPPTGRTPTAPPAAAPRALEAGVPAPAGGWSADSADGFRADAFDDHASHAEAAPRGTTIPDRRPAREPGPRPPHARPRARPRRLPRPGGRRPGAGQVAAAAGRRPDHGRAVPRPRGPGAGLVPARPHRAVADAARHRDDGRLRAGGASTTSSSARAGCSSSRTATSPAARCTRRPPGSRSTASSIDLARIRTIGEEVHDRIAEAIALAAGAQELLNPPPVTPVIVVVGATIVNHSRPRGVIVTRPGDLGRALRTRGERMTPAAVEETYAVARRPETWE